MHPPSAWYANKYIYILRALEALKNAAYKVSRNCACSNFCSESHNNSNTDFFYGIYQPSMSNAKWAGELFPYTSSVTAARAWRWPSTILVKTSIRSFLTSPVNSFPVLYSCCVQPTNQHLLLPDYNACALGFKVLHLLIEIHHATNLEPEKKMTLETTHLLSCHWLTQK